MSIHTNLIKYGLHSNKNFTNLNKKIHFNGEQSGGSKKDSKNYFVPAGLFMHGGGEKEEEERTDIVKSKLYAPYVVAKIEQPAKDKRQTNIEIYLKRPKADISSTIEYKTPEHLNLLYNTKIDASEHRKNENKKRKQEEDKKEKETGNNKGKEEEKEKEGEEEKEKTKSGGFKLTRKEKGKIKLRKTRKKKHRKNKQIKLKFI
tara:strand:- start:38 stop:646 length:609 start_codon:yes stop_codon:yes gene_type:complete